MMHPDSYEDGSSVFNVQLIAFFFFKCHKLFRE